MGIHNNKKAPTLKAITLSVGLSIVMTSGLSFAASDQDLLNMCQACHGNDGSSQFASIPNLKWQNQAYMVQQLEHFKSDQRQDKTMSKVAKLLTTEQMEAIASYFHNGKEE